MKQQPFYVGQKVVCVKKGRRRAILGKEYTVAGLEQCQCGRWYVYVYEIKDPNPCIPFSCESCPRLKHSHSGLARCRIELFAPLNPPRVNAIPELLKAPVEERVDHHQPVKILTKDG